MSDRLATRLSLAAIVAAFLLRLPAIVAPLGPDQGVYVTIGWGLSRGLTLYRDLWEMKPPGIYVTYFLGMLVFGGGTSATFWLDFLAGAVTVLAVFGIGRQLMGTRFGALAGAVVAVGTLPAARYAYGGFLERSVTETFIMPLASLAIWATVVWIDRPRTRWVFAAGLLIGIAFVYKQTAAIYWPALVLWVGWTTTIARARRFALVSLAGIIIAPIVALSWLWLAGALDDAWTAFVRYNVAYLSLGSLGPMGTLHRFAQECWKRQRSDEIWAIGSLGAVLALVPAFVRRTTPSGRLASLAGIWLGAALVAVAANGPRLFTTYFTPPQVPLCLLAAWLFSVAVGSRPRWKLVTGVALLALTALLLVRSESVARWLGSSDAGLDAERWSGSAVRAVRSISWDLQYITGRIDRPAYLDRYKSQASKGFSAANNATLADYVLIHTVPSDRIFVFGMTGGTYYFSQRLPASRFLFAYPAVSNMGNRPEFRVETLAAELGRSRPRYIILQRSNGDSFSGWRAAEAFKAPALAELLMNYREETEIGDFLLYRRIE